MLQIVPLVLIDLFTRDMHLPNPSLIFLHFPPKKHPYIHLNQSRISSTLQ